MANQNFGKKTYLRDFKLSAEFPSHVAMFILFLFVFSRNGQLVPNELHIQFLRRVVLNINFNLETFAVIPNLGRYMKTNWTGPSQLAFCLTISVLRPSTPSIICLGRLRIASKCTLNLWQLRQRVDSLAQWLEHWIFNREDRVRFPRESGNFFSYASFLCCDLHVVRWGCYDRALLRLSALASYA